MLAQKFLRAGFSLLFASGCIVEQGITYIVPGKDASTPNVRDGASDAPYGNSGGAGPTGGRGGWGGATSPGGAAGVGMGGAGIGGVGGAGNGGVSGAGAGGKSGAGGASGATDAGRDADGTSGDAAIDADARTDIDGMDDASTDGDGSDSRAGAGGTGGSGTGGSGTGGSGTGGSGTGGSGTGGSGTGGSGTGGTSAGGAGGSTGGTTGTGGGGTGGSTGGSAGTGGGGTSIDAGHDAPNDGGSGTITEFNIPTPNAGAYDIVRGADGNLWFTEEMGNKIGRITVDGVITEYSIPTANARPRGLTASGARIYFTEFAANQIGYLDTANPSAITEAACLAGPTGMATDFGGVVWYTAVGANEVVKLASNGTAAGHWSTPNGVNGAIALVLTYSLWLGTNAQGRMDTVDPSTNGMSALTFPDDALGQPVTDMLIDWNDDFWVLDGPALRRFDGLTFSASGSMRSVVQGPVATASVKNLYITAPSINAILVKSTGASLTIYPIPTAGGSPHDIIDGADKNLWFTERTGNKIGRLVP